MYIYLAYYDGIDVAIEKTSPKMDVASLPDDSGYYYSTLYGLDNIRIPIIYSFLPQLLNLKFLSEKPYRACKHSGIL
ncbi:MAG: hypothetical protein QW421_06755 [Archaeoglobaceae archaeon]